MGSEDSHTASRSIYKTFSFQSGISCGRCHVCLTCDSPDHGDRKCAVVKAALRAAKVDEDIVLLVGRAASLIEDAPILPPEDVTNRAKNLVVPLGVAVEKLNEKEKCDGINKWRITTLREG